MVTAGSVSATLDVRDPLYCETSASEHGWPPLCVVLAAAGADVFAARLEYRPDLTRIDAEEVWVRVYDGVFERTAGRSDPARPAGFSRMEIINPTGFASPTQEREKASLGISITGLDDLVAGTSLDVLLVDRLLR
jgi:hypothetical protein